MFSSEFTEHYNEASYEYLSNCAALQALRVLEAQTGVNKSQLIVGGDSWGGYNAMVVGGVYPQKVKAVIDYICAGDFPAFPGEPREFSPVDLECTYPGI